MPEHASLVLSDAPPQWATARDAYVRAHPNKVDLSADAAEQAARVWANHVAEPDVRRLWTPVTWDPTKRKSAPLTDAAVRVDIDEALPPAPQTAAVVRVWWHPMVFDAVVDRLRGEAVMALLADLDVGAAARLESLDNAWRAWTEAASPQLFLTPGPATAAQREAAVAAWVLGSALAAAPRALSALYGAMAYETNALSVRHQTLQQTAAASTALQQLAHRRAAVVAELRRTSLPSMAAVAAGWGATFRKTLGHAGLSTRMAATDHRRPRGR